MKQKEKHKKVFVFLSYSIADIEHAHKLERILSQHLYVRLFTPEMLSTGKDWVSKLKKEISRCDLFFVIVSPNSIYSSWVLKELGAAWAMGKSIVLVLTHPEILSRVPIQIKDAKILSIDELEKPEIINQLLEQFLELTTSHTR